MLDLKIHNGLIIDGMGSPAYHADIGISDDKIVLIGSIEQDALETINAEGNIICPGFIDLHSHSDTSFLIDSNAQSKLRQGVTLELNGNCGFSFSAPLKGPAIEIYRNTTFAESAEGIRTDWPSFSEYISVLKSTEMPINTALQVGHNTIRACVLGMDPRMPNLAELDNMRNLVSESLDAGAMGFSTGLVYTPGNYARLEEIIEISQEAAKRGKLYSTHMRDEGSQSIGLLVAVSEAIEIGRRTGAKVEISHVKCKGPSVWGMGHQILEMMEQGIRDGIDLAGDQYPYTASSTFLSQALIQQWALAGGRNATTSLINDADEKQNLLVAIRDRIAQYGTPENVVISRHSPKPEFEGMTLAEIATHNNSTAEESAIELFMESDGGVILHTYSEEDVETIAQSSIISVGSDGSSLSTEGPLSSGKPHPRNFGTFPRFIRKFCREKNLMPLTEAIRKMTSLPASRLGLLNRGRIAPGFAADIVIFDEDNITDNATFDNPFEYPSGIKDVFVNGTHSIKSGEYTGKKSGRLITNFND